MREFKVCELTKLELKYDDTHIKLEKKKEIIKAPQMNQQTVPVVEVNQSQPASELEAPVISGHEIKAPMVGTVYVAPEPDADAFVSVGQKVKKGDIVCIIEAMKLMNEVEAEIDGEIVEVLIDNEQMVEFGEPLFVIEP